MPREEAKALFTLTKQHIVGTKQGNSKTNIILRITNNLKAKKNIGEEKLMLYYPILCVYTDVDCFFSCEQAGVCATFNAFQTRAMPCMCTLHCYFSAGVFPILVNFTEMEKLHC